MEFVRTFPTVDFKTIVESNCSFSAAQYRGFCIKNSNRKKVREFLSRQLTSNDLGSEVGSLNYIERSPKIFLKTKALQAHSFIPNISRETAENIRPSYFVDKHLKKGDLIISKDGNIGEAVILDRDYPDAMLSGALYRLPIRKDKYYLFAFLKHPLFREQLDFMAPKGSVLRHCKTIFLDCEIPIPNFNPVETVRYVECIVESIIRKESLIRERFNAIIQMIENELTVHQKSSVFSYALPNYSEVKETGRLDASVYGVECKRIIFKIKNYSHGYKTIFDLGYTMSRGQNLQVSNIGDSIYSDTYFNNFYTLILPRVLSEYGTPEKVQYLGNPRQLKTLKKGDLIFGAEGCGRSFVVVEDQSRTITNIHGITIQRPNGGGINDAIFIKCFLDYLRCLGLIDMLAVGGNGGSLAQKYWGLIPFPSFPEELKNNIAQLYHNPTVHYDGGVMTDANFEDKNVAFDSVAGICELDWAVKHLKSLLNVAIEKIANDEDVERKY